MTRKEINRPYLGEENIKMLIKSIDEMQPYNEMTPAEVIGYRVAKMHAKMLISRMWSAAIICAEIDSPARFEEEELDEMAATLKLIANTLQGPQGE